jgi:hypothetical protein
MYGIVLFYYASTGDTAVELLVRFMGIYGHGILLCTYTSWMCNKFAIKMNDLI